MRTFLIVLWGVSLFIFVLAAQAQTPVTQGQIPNSPDNVSSEIYGTTVAKVLTATLVLIGLIVAIFVFALPYLESQHEGEFTTQISIMSMKLSFTWKEGAYKFLQITIFTNVFSILYEILSKPWLLQFCRLLLIVQALWAVLLLIAAFRDLPALVRRVKVSDELERHKPERPSCYELYKMNGP
jgi:hypothetical protein